MYSHSFQVNINACLTGVAAGTKAAAAGGSDAAALTSSVAAAAAEQKWKSSNVKAVVTNGKSLGQICFHTFTCGEVIRINGRQGNLSSYIWSGTLESRSNSEMTAVTV